MSDVKVDTTSPTYNRPQHNWVCGLSTDGHPCALGPSAAGACRVETLCQPIFRQGQWVCGADGDPCENGPTPTGGCPCLAEKCQPQRSVRARRGLLTLGAAALVFGLWALTVSGPWRSEILAPGPLSQVHGQILTGEQRCAACHPAAEAGVATWLLATVPGGDPFTTSQTDLCLDCHDKSLAVETARLAHGIDPAILSQITEQHVASLGLVNKRDIPAHLQGEIACSTCHREHRGAANLSALTTEQCQSCHQQQIDGFENGHPEFADWPYGQESSVNFDHAAHVAKHFKQVNRSMSCQECHVSDDDEVYAVASYETTCAACHDKFLEQVDDVAFLSLPSIDPGALARIRLTVGQWPDVAAGGFDGGVPIFARILLLTDIRAKAAMERLGFDFEFIDIDHNDKQQLRDAAQIAWSLKKLIYELATDGQLGIKRRLQKLLGRELVPREMRYLSGRFPPSVFRAAQRQWFPDLAEEIATRQLVAAEAPAESALEDGNPKQAVAAGGWYVDHEICAIFYQPAGHSDELTRGWIDFLAELTERAAADADYQWRKEFTGYGLANQCATCHTAAAQGVWTRERSPSNTRSFTHFAHGPHLVLPAFADCTSCHELHLEAASSSNDDLAISPRDASSGAEFVALNQADCATCHTADGAGNDCTQCHRYHVSAP